MKHVLTAVLVLTAMSWFAFSVLGLAINNWLGTLISAFTIMVIVEQITPFQKPSAEHPHPAENTPSPQASSEI